MATSDLSNTSSTAKAAFEMPLDQFLVWLETDQTKPIMDAKTKKQKVDANGVPMVKVGPPSAPSWGTSTSGEKLHRSMRSPFLRRGERTAPEGVDYKEGDLGYLTTYGMELVLAELEGTLRIPAAIRDSIIGMLDADRDASDKQRSERLDVARSKRDAADKVKASTNNAFDDLVRQGMITAAALESLHANGTLTDEAYARALALVPVAP